MRYVLIISAPAELVCVCLSLSPVSTCSLYRAFWWWSRLLMDAAILIVIVDSACKFHSRVIWPQSHLGSDSLSHPMNSVATPSHHLKFDRVRVTTKKKFGALVMRCLLLTSLRCIATTVHATRQDRLGPLIRLLMFLLVLSHRRVIRGWS